MKRLRTVGILGGMGPEATVDLMQRVIRSTPATDDSDHIRMIVDNNPYVPSRIRALIDGTGESPAPCLREMARGLEEHGVDFLAIPCNTAHKYYDEIVTATSVPVLHMIELTADRVLQSNPGLDCVGILASDAVIRTSLYSDCFNASPVRVVYPCHETQMRLMQAIKDIKAGERGNVQRQALADAARDLETQGADAVVIACTELSLMADFLDVLGSVYDAAQILAEEIVEAAVGKPATRR